MAAQLQFVEIPGYRDALRRESDVRRQAWCHTHTEIAGVRVRLLTLRDMVLLEEMQNGFFAPWRFDDTDEYLAHCAQLVWWLSDCRKPRLDARQALSPIVAHQRTRLIRHLAARPHELSAGVRDFLKASFQDAPKGSGFSGSAIAGAPAYIADTLAAGGLFVGLDEMLDMPLVKLWQLVRMAARRVYGTTITNESDRLATDYLATLNQKN